MDAIFAPQRLQGRVSTPTDTATADGQRFDLQASDNSAPTGVMLTKTPPVPIFS